MNAFYCFIVALILSAPSLSDDPVFNLPILDRIADRIQEIDSRVREHATATARLGDRIREFRDELKEWRADFRTSLKTFFRGTFWLVIAICSAYTLGQVVRVLELFIRKPT